MRSKIEIVLRAMMAGQSVIFPGDPRKYQLVKDDEDKWRFCTDVLRYRLGDKGTDPEVQLMNVEAPLEWFLNACEKMSEEDVTLMGANTVLMEINRKERP